MRKFVSVIIAVLFANICFAQNINTEEISITGNTKQLSHFFNSLDETKSKKVRIAHYGDSIILGDIVSESVRDNLQAKFGGRGIGLVPIFSNTHGMRKSLLQDFSKDWEYAAVFQRNPKSLPVGINGAVSVAGSNSWVSYQISKYLGTFKEFNRVRLFYSNSKSTDKIKYIFDEKKSNSAVLKNTNQIDATELKMAKGKKHVKIDCSSAEGAYFYGVSFEGGNGLYLDNLPLTGNSGVSIVNIPVDKIREFNELMNYKLIILQFGVNVYTKGSGSFKIYERQMAKVIKHLRKALPDTSILIVSSGDKTTKVGSKMLTDRDVFRLVRIQKRIAERAGVAFWNLFSAMGGKNSMIKWVKAKPSLALMDYTHFSKEGGKIVGDLLTEALIKEYKKYSK